MTLRRATRWFIVAITLLTVGLAVALGRGHGGPTHARIPTPACIQTACSPIATPPR